MTAPKQNLKSEAASASDHAPSVDSCSEGRCDSGLSAGQRLQRGWLVAFGLMSSCGFVASQVNFARAESDYAEGEYAVESSYLEDPDAPLAVDSASATASAEPAVVSPTVTPIASPAFSSEPKLIAKKAVYRSHPLVGMIEPGMVATPIASYVSTPVSTVSYTPPATEATEASTAVSSPAVSSPVVPAPVPDSSPAAIAQPQPTVTPAAPITPPAAPVVEIAPEIIPDAAPVFTPAPTAGAAPVSPTASVLPAAPAADEIVPTALPEGITRPGEYDSIFIDPTDYSVGATEPSTTQTPNVVVAEQSTGCTFTISQGQNVPDGACGTAPLGTPETGIADAGEAATVADAATPSTGPSQAASAASAAAVNVGPVSFSASGIRLSTSAAGREYLNRSVRPVVNLQAAAKFIFPLSVPSPISSLFGFRTHPIFGDQRFHTGTDIAAAQGTPVLAAQDGVITATGAAGGYGLMVVMQHDLEEETFESRYAHLSEIFVESGEAVNKGDVVGLVGSTGNSTGPHLHFEMRQMTANGWVLLNPDGLVQASLARLVQALNNPVQTISFDISDFKLKNLRADQQSASSSELPSLPGQDGLPYRPAQPNAS
ncbi:MAG: peptidoglycan DD-metalloendopeptidase family protein [Cyanobacteria bacterium P01_D01_bin.1]